MYVYVLGLSLFYNVIEQLGNTIAGLDKLVNHDENNDAALLSGTNHDHDRPTYVVPQYTFPDAIKRLEYYMGSYDNKTDWKVTNCPPKLKAENIPKDGSFTFFDLDHIFSLATLEACSIHIKIPYCDDAYEILKRSSSVDGENTLAVFNFGDRSTSHQLPAVSKSRPALKENQHSPIIWPLNMRRHYGPIEQYDNLVKKKGIEVPWEDKESKVFWRGSTTGVRVQQLSRWLQYDANIIDIGFE